MFVIFYCCFVVIVGPPKSFPPCIPAPLDVSKCMPVSKKLTLYVRQEFLLEQEKKKCCSRCLEVEQWPWGLHFSQDSFLSCARSVAFFKLLSIGKSPEANRATYFLAHFQQSYFYSVIKKIKWIISSSFVKIIASPMKSIRVHYDAWSGASFPLLLEHFKCFQKVGIAGTTNIGYTINMSTAIYFYQVRDLRLEAVETVDTEFPNANLGCCWHIRKEKLI